MSQLPQLPPVHTFQLVLKQHRYSPPKILIFLYYLIETRDEEAEEDQQLQIYKTLKKIILEKSCLDSLKGVATFVMGMVMIGHIHIYEKFNKFILPGLVSLYQQNQHILKEPKEKVSSLNNKISQKDSLIEKIEENSKNLQQWIAHFSNQLLSLLGKWLPKDFYKRSSPSIYIRIIKQNQIRDPTSGIVSKRSMTTYTSQLLKNIEKFIQKMNIGSENYCNLCWKYQVMNNKQSNENQLNNLFKVQDRPQRRASRKMQQYKMRKLRRQSMHKARMNQIMKELRQKSLERDLSQSHGTETTRSFKNMQYSHVRSFQKILPCLENQNRSNHDKFSAICFFNCAQFENLSNDKQTLFKKYLIKKNNGLFGPNLREVLDFQISQKIHKGIIKLKYKENKQLPVLLEPKNLLKKSNKLQKYFLIDFQDKIRRIILQLPEDQNNRIIYPFGYLKILQNCQVNEWQAAKNTLRNQSFILNEQICPDIDTIVRRLDLKCAIGRGFYNKQKIYESFFKVCKKTIKLTLKVEEKTDTKVILIQGWCDQNIQSIMVLDELLSQIKFCYGNN